MEGFEVVEKMKMVENIRKRKQISVKEKLEILNMIDCGEKLSAVARQFGISSSTASTIVKERFKIKLLSEHYNIAPERKRMRLGLFRDVDEAVNIWFRQQRNKNSPVNGPMLQQKAREFAVQLGHKNFEGSSGWLSRFRERFGLSMKVMRDEDHSDLMPGIGMTDDEIVASVYHSSLHLKTKRDNQEQPTHSETEKSSKPVSTEPKVDFKDAILCAAKLTCFFKRQENIPTHILKALHHVSDFMLNDLQEKLKQRKITDYFKPLCSQTMQIYVPVQSNHGFSDNTNIEHDSYTLESYHHNIENNPTHRKNLELKYEPEEIISTPDNNHLTEDDYFETCSELNH
ncbi:uncharacterized protein LOC129226329 [Uloborus diversus]|uniref:uncharacterized protein LOC129226329 n=1 Tax=Uloborus diversus TaxID=327109 RepID=UPI0024097E86|nr:uncharacterized protein LOC129226329 [Uloborus diversus]